MTEATNFPAVFGLLKQFNVKFVVVGGVSARAYLSQYVTYDLDICYARDDENLVNLATVLQKVNARLRGAPPGLKFRLDARTLRSGLNFTFDTDLGPIDILGEVSGVGDYSKAALDSRRMPEFDVQVLSLEKLIAAKKAAARPKDLALLGELEFVARVNQHLDIDLLPAAQRVREMVRLLETGRYEQYQLAYYTYSLGQDVPLEELDDIVSAIPETCREELRFIVSRVELDPGESEQTRELLMKWRKYFNLP
jgi:hypothetical protein